SGAGAWECELGFGGCADVGGFEPGARVRLGERRAQQRRSDEQILHGARTPLAIEDTTKGETPAWGQMLVVSQCVSNSIRFSMDLLPLPDGSRRAPFAFRYTFYRSLTVTAPLAASTTYGAVTVRER